MKVEFVAFERSGVDTVRVSEVVEMTQCPQIGDRVKNVCNKAEARITGRLWHPKDALEDGPNDVTVEVG